MLGVLVVWNFVKCFKSENKKMASRTFSEEKKQLSKWKEGILGIMWGHVHVSAASSRQLAILVHMNLDLEGHVLFDKYFVLCSRKLRINCFSIATGLS